MSSPSERGASSSRAQGRDAFFRLGDVFRRALLEVAVAEGWS